MSAPEKWMPVPVRLVREVTTAPTLRKRAWAAAYLLAWLIAFDRTREGQSASIRDLGDWAACSNKSRISSAKAAALAWLAAWLGEEDSSRTVFGQHSDSARTEVGQSDPVTTDSAEQVSDTSGTPLGHLSDDRARLPSTGTGSTEVQDTPTPETIPTEQITLEPVDSSDSSVEKVDHSETEGEASPRDLSVEAAFTSAGSMFLEAGRAAHVAGFATLGEIAAVGSRGALIGQLKQALEIPVEAGTRTAAVVESIRRGTPRIATAIERVMRRHGVEYDTASETPGSVPDWKVRAEADWGLVDRAISRWGGSRSPRPVGHPGRRNWLFDYDEAHPLEQRQQTHSRILATLNRVGVLWCNLAASDDNEFERIHKRFLAAWPGTEAETRAAAGVAA